MGCLMSFSDKVWFEGLSLFQLSKIIPAAVPEKKSMIIALKCVSSIMFENTTVDYFERTGQNNKQNKNFRSFHFVFNFDI